MSDEFFSIGDDGRKSDAALHDEILDNPEADKLNRIATAKRAVASGMDEVTARQLYDIPNEVGL
jgi:hypothetical protein